MEDKNNELLGRIAAAETQIHKEEVSGLVFGGSTRLHEKKKAAVRARQEYVYCALHYGDIVTLCLLYSTSPSSALSEGMRC
jgi:hypothetical protein